MGLFSFWFYTYVLLWHENRHVWLKIQIFILIYSGKIKAMADNGAEKVQKASKRKKDGWEMRWAVPRDERGGGRRMEVAMGEKRHVKKQRRIEMLAGRRWSCDCGVCFSCVGGSGHHAAMVTGTWVIFTRCCGDRHKQQQAVVFGQNKLWRNRGVCFHSCWHTHVSLCPLASSLQWAERTSQVFLFSLYVGHTLTAGLSEP